MRGKLNEDVAIVARAFDVTVFRFGWCALGNGQRHLFYRRIQCRADAGPRSLKQFLEAGFAGEHYRLVNHDGYLSVVIEASVRPALLVDISPSFINDPRVARNATIFNESLLTRTYVELFKANRAHSVRVPNKNSVRQEIQPLTPSGKNWNRNIALEIWR